MQDYVFLLKSDKGFYTSDGVKVYFPDRKCQGIHGGIAKVISFKDMGKYGFIVCEMVDTKSISDAFNNGLVDITSVDFVKSVDGTQYWCIDNKYFAYIEDKVVEIGFERETLNTEKFRFDLSFKSCMSMQDNKDYLDCLNKYWTNYIESRPEVEEHDMVEAIIRKLPRHLLHSICVYQNKLVTFTIGSYTRYFYHNGVRLKEFDFHLSDSFLVEKQDWTDKIKNILIENNIALVNDCDDDVVKLSVSCLGNTFSRRFINSSKFSYALLENVEEILKKDEEDFEAFRKRIGKYVTKSNLQEFAKLNIRRLQLGE